MSEKWVLAVDLGTGGPKVARVALDGTILASASRPVATAGGPDGSSTQDATTWWTGLVAAAREVCADADPMALHVVGITGQWGSTVPVGADMEPTAPVMLWSDTRGRDLVRTQLGGRVTVSGYSPIKVLPFIRIAAGAPNTDGADPTGHALVLKHTMPDVYARTRVLLEPVDYLGLRLTGVARATPASMTLSWLTDQRPGAPEGADGGYVAELIRRAGRDRSLLPDLVPTGSILGPLSDSAAAELGVCPGVPVICGIPDLHAAVLGSGATRPFDTHMAISTSAWMGARVPFKRTDLLHSIATVPGLDVRFPVVANNHETGGGALEWLRDTLYPTATLEDLVALAATAPAGSGGVMFTPWLAGERSPVDDKLLRAGFLGLGRGTDSAAMVRAVLEGVAYNQRWLLDPYRTFLGRAIPTMRVLGGGAVSDLWCQIHADIMDITLERVATPRQAQLRGVALWARIALGELTLADVPGLVTVTDTFRPSPQHRAVHDRRYAEFRRLAGTLKGFYHRMAAR